MNHVAIPTGACCYFVRNGAGLVKIGTSANICQRLASLRTASGDELQVLRVISGGRATERWLHKRYASLRTIGEWFRFSADMLQVVPPDEVPVRRKEVRRRDVRLTIRERMADVDERALDLGVNARHSLMMLVQQLSDEEAAHVLGLIRQHDLTIDRSINMMAAE